MAPEIRTILRYMDDYITSGNLNEALERGVQALVEYDKDREFDNAIEILEKLISVAELQNDIIQAAKFVDYLRVRTLLAHDKEKFAGLVKQYEYLPVTPLSTLLKTEDAEKKIILETIERQSIFGDFVALPNVPFLKFNQGEDALNIVEDYYEEGRYIINLVDTSTSLHQALNIDIGKPEEVNIVERQHIYKIE